MWPPHVIPFLLLSSFAYSPAAPPARRHRAPPARPAPRSSYAAANRVVVAGTADAAALKARLEAKTKKAVEIISAGSGAKRPAPAAEPKDAGAGEKKADKDASPKEEKEKKQQPEEKKPKEVGTQQAMPPTQSALSPPLLSTTLLTLQLKNASAFGSPQETVLLKIRLHCDGCADRIRRRIYKIKGVSFCFSALL
jgi:hypothetical protein